MRVAVEVIIKKFLDYLSTLLRKVDIFTHFITKNNDLKNIFVLPFILLLLIFSFEYLKSIKIKWMKLDFKLNQTGMLRYQILC